VQELSLPAPDLDDLAARKLDPSSEASGEIAMEAAEGGRPALSRLVALRVLGLLWIEAAVRHETA